MTAARDKIAKLLNMTVENGATEDEAETAMKLAAGIAAREGIDLDSCRPAGAPMPKAILKAQRQELKPHQAILADAAARLYGVECNIYNLGKGGISFVGRESNIELAEETWFWLMRQVEGIYKTMLPKGLSKTARAEYRKTFKAACALRVQERADALMRELKRNDSTAQQATGQNALVVQGYFDQLAKEVDDFWNDRFKLTPEQQARADARKAAEEARRAALTDAEREKEDKAKAREAERLMKKLAKRKGPRQRSIPVGSGTNAGFAAGDSVQLRREVN